ncbi:MAG TPA: hypothetical protein VIP77_21225 [Jiangellaceae bacterium]
MRTRFMPADAVPLSGPAEIAARAAYVLRDNSTDSATKAGPGLYPHQWSWDAGFNAIGLSRLDPRRAALELDSLFAGQWGNGMVPHIVFDPAVDTYFPGAGRWECARLSDAAPDRPATSGITQPPVHALAAAEILATAARRGADEAQIAREWFATFQPKLLRWHRFLADDRTDPGTGLVVIHHGWESGLDNSPRWDGPSGRVVVGPDLQPFARRDTAHVADAAERPSDAEYDRYLWLVEEAKRAGYDPARMRETCSFAVGDVLFTAIFAAASDLLADLTIAGTDSWSEGSAATVDWLRDRAEAARLAVLAQVDDATGLAADVDVRTGEPLRTATIAGFAPLIAGAPDVLRRQLTAELTGPRWAGHPSLRWAVPPSTSPESPAFRPRTYWRGPVWPVMTWLLGWALERGGETGAATALRDAALDQLREGSFAEYYEPVTGEPLGGPHQSWTAAVALAWLLDG